MQWYAVVDTSKQPNTLQVYEHSKKKKRMKPWVLNGLVLLLCLFVFFFWHNPCPGTRRRNLQICGNYLQDDEDTFSRKTTFL